MYPWKRTAYAQAAALMLFAPLALPQGGPPFLSDDPDTPGKGHWEINMGYLGDRNPARGSYQTPNMDINYGWGSRIQLKYELPFAIEEIRGSQGHVAAGLGNSLVGVKYRFFEHRFKHHVKDGERQIHYSLSTYPQLVLSNPTRSVARGIVDQGPQFLLPLEASAVIGPVRMSAETGYWFASNKVPNSWIRGIVVGHEFEKDTELYVELYDFQNVSGVAGAEKLRESTIGLGGRIPIVRGHWLRLIGMGGRSLVPATQSNGQPSWIAYVGLQFLSDQRRRHGDQ